MELGLREERCGDKANVMIDSTFGIVGLLDEIGKVNLSSLLVVAELILVILVKDTSPCGVIEEIILCSIGSSNCELAVIDRVNPLEASSISVD